MAEGPSARPAQVAAHLYRQHSKEVLAFFRCSRRMSAEDAGDLLQQTFEELLKTLENNPELDLANPKAYLFRIAHWQFAAHLKRKGRRPTLVDEAAGPEPASEAESDDLELLAAMRSDQRLLLRAMRRLTDEDDAKATATAQGLDDERGGSTAQLMLYLRYWAGLSLAEVAEVFEAPQGTVSGRLRRALALLRQRVDALGSVDAATHHTSTTVLRHWQEALELEAAQLVPDRGEDR
jgi:RNA polymerase sigma factor (sigma-70 family)